jgi:DNA polymerase-3 subunit delta
MAQPSSKRSDENSPDLVLRDLRKGQIGPLYWIFGAEQYLVNRLVEALRAKVLQGSPRGFNYDLFIGKETSAAQLLQAARTLPMMAPRRLVLVKDAHELKPAELETFSAYLKDPPKETTLVFLSEKVDRRVKFFQSFSKSGLLVECKPLYENQLGPFLREEAKEHGLSLGPEVPELLAQVVGTSLGSLAGALEKIALYISPRTDVSPDDALAAVADTRARSVFELTEAVAHKNLGQALMILRRLTEHDRGGSDLIPLVGTLAWQWRQLIKGSVLKAKGLPKGEVIKELGIFFRQADEYWTTLSRFDPRELRDKHGELMRADLALKSSPLSGATIVEGLLMKLCR